MIKGLLVALQFGHLYLTSFANLFPQQEQITPVFTGYSSIHTGHSIFLSFDILLYMMMIGIFVPTSEC